MTSAVRLIRSDRLSEVADDAYAATAPPHAQLVFLAGACPLDEAGATVSPGDYAAQAARCACTTWRSRSMRPGRRWGTSSIRAEYQDHRSRPSRAGAGGRDP